MELQGRRVVGVFGVVFLVLLERVEFIFEVTDLGLIACGFGRFDLGLVLVDVLVDGFQ